MTKHTAILVDDIPSALQLLENDIVAYINQGYITEEKLDREYYRWLYTAITRTSLKTHLVNFKDEFFAI